MADNRTARSLTFQGTEHELDRLRHPSEALATVLSHTSLLPSEQVSLAEAGGRILAADFHASEDFPPFPASTMDGYAVIANDGSPWRDVVGVQAAGQLIDAEVTPGAAIKIMTGAPLPKGADAVVRVENTESADDHVIIHQEFLQPGENVRQIGSDVKAGQLLVPAGTKLEPAEIGLLATYGGDPVTVRRKPRVSIVSTGDELLEPSEPLTPGKIRDSNRYMLRAALESAGAEVIWAGKGPDVRDELEPLLVRLIADSDIVITSGGVSMGDLDLIKPILLDLSTVHFRRVFLKPGKPLNFATAGPTLIFGLTGNPVSALVGFELFIRSAIRKMTGSGEGPETIRVTLGADTEPTDRVEYQRAVLSVDGQGRLAAVPNGPQGSSRLASFLGANALIVIPPRETVYKAGEMVDAILIGPVAGSGVPQAEARG
jgi:molybdenum cofactor synthesis domain-containing protein